jgi:hypothetical protein
MLMAAPGAVLWVLLILICFAAVLVLVLWLKPNRKERNTHLVTAHQETSVSDPTNAPQHYAEAYEMIGEELRRMLETVTTDEDAHAFVEQATQRVISAAASVPEFYPGEFYVPWGQVTREDLIAEATKVQCAMEDLIAAPAAVVDEFNERLRIAREAGDREAEHEVWREEDRKRKEMAAVLNQGNALLVRLKAVHELGTALGLTRSQQEMQGADVPWEPFPSNSGDSNESSTPAGGQGEGAMANNVTIDEVWRRIIAREGEIFRQIRGRAFTYVVEGNVLRPSTVNQNLSRATFEEALARVPFASTMDVQDLRGPSYLFAILMDRRIRQQDW